MRVSSRDPSDLVWLAEFLECGFEEVSGPSRDYDVRIEVDPNAYDIVLKEGPTSGPSVEGFAKDSNPKMFDRWSPGGTYRDPSLSGFYRVSNADNSVEILVREKTKKCRTAFMRVVRELVMDRIVSTGGILMHAAAVGYEGGVIVVSGPKRRGKTTLLLSLLSATGAQYVCNDRCVLRVDKQRSATVRGMPTLISIRSDGLRSFPAFRRRLLDARPDLFSSPEFPAAARRPSFSLAPQEFCRLLTCKKASGGPIAAFLFPRITTNPKRITLRRLSESEALLRFREGLFRASHPTVLGEVFVSPATRGRGSWEAAAQVGHWVASSLPCFDCELGGDSAPSAEDCAELLERVRTTRRESG